MEPRVAVITLAVADLERSWRVGEIRTQALDCACPAKKRGAQKDERILLHTLVLALQVGGHDLAADRHAAIGEPSLKRFIYLVEGHGRISEG